MQKVFISDQNTSTCQSWLVNMLHCMVKKIDIANAGIYKNFHAFCFKLVSKQFDENTKTSNLAWRPCISQHNFQIKYFYDKLLTVSS